MLSRKIHGKWPKGKILDTVVTNFPKAGQKYSIVEINGQKMVRFKDKDVSLAEINRETLRFHSKQMAGAKATGYPLDGVLKEMRSKANGRKVLGEIERFMPQGTAVEVGAGHAASLRKYFGGFRKLIGVEAAKMEKPPLGVLWIRGDMKRIPLAGNSVELVLASASLGRLPWPRQGIEEMGRVLKKGGYAVVIEPDLSAKYITKTLENAGFRVRYKDIGKIKTVVFATKLYWSAGKRE